MKWRACSQGQTFDSGEGLVVFFDPASGSTHLIDYVADWLLEELAANPLSTEKLLSRFMLHASGITGSEAKKLVEDQLRTLQSSDLIEIY